MTDMLDAQQRAFLDCLARHPDKVCECGWYWKTECASRCRATVPGLKAVVGSLRAEVARLRAEREENDPRRTAP